MNIIVFISTVYVTRLVFVSNGGHQNIKSIFIFFITVIREHPEVKTFRL